MNIMSISIVESAEQLIAGFPRTVSLSSNIPASIFYTLDGTEPSTFSSVYVDPIRIPTNQSEVILKIFATNGEDYSPILTKEYSTNIIKTNRLPHSAVAGITNSRSGYPFGSGTQINDVVYLPPDVNPAIVNNPALPIIPLGYDAAGNRVGGTNLPLIDYLLIPPLVDNQNRQLPGVIPGNREVVGRSFPVTAVPQSSDRASKLFNPKAMVIFQDSTTEDPSAPPMINRHEFSSELAETYNYGSKLSATSLETPTITGSFLKSYHNPRTGMMTNYYRDSSTNKWIISSSPYQSKPLQQDVPLMVSPRGPRIIGKVFELHLFQRRVLT